MFIDRRMETSGLVQRNRVATGWYPLATQGSRGSSPFWAVRQHGRMRRKPRAEMLPLRFLLLLTSREAWRCSKAGARLDLSFEGGNFSSRLLQGQAPSRIQASSLLFTPPSRAPFCLCPWAQGHPERKLRMGSGDLEGDEEEGGCYELNYAPRPPSSFVGRLNPQCLRIYNWR